jgi:hypothetical protein
VIVLQGPQSFPFGDLGVALRLNLSLAFAICIFGLREDPEEVFTRAHYFAGLVNHGDRFA